MFNPIPERGSTPEKDILSVKEIREIALSNGFKLKIQKDGGMDLNPYVYTFVRALVRKLTSM